MHPPHEFPPHHLPPRRRPAPKRARHDGAWKVAYADFVTALMALFIVLWMMNASVMVKKSITGYFRDPIGFNKRNGAGVASNGEGLPVTRQTAASLQQMIEQALRNMPDFDQLRNHVKLSVTGEGLRIDLIENEKGTFFLTGSVEPTALCQRMLGVLAAEVARMPNSIVVEGHTDATPFRNATPDSGYSNWELSTDRANAARRTLYAGGLPTGRVVEVRGFGDQKLLEPNAPESPRNRRISIVIRLVD